MFRGYHNNNNKAAFLARPGFKQSSSGGVGSGRKFGTSWTTGTAKTLRRIPPPAHVPSLEAQQRKFAATNQRGACLSETIKWNVKSAEQIVPASSKEPVASSKLWAANPKEPFSGSKADFPDLKPTAHRPSVSSSVAQQRIAKAVDSLSRWKVEPSVAAQTTTTAAPVKPISPAVVISDGSCWLDLPNTVNYEEKDIFASDERVENESDKSVPTPSVQETVEKSACQPQTNGQDKPDTTAQVVPSQVSVEPEVQSSAANGCDEDIHYPVDNVVQPCTSAVWPSIIEKPVVSQQQQQTFLPNQHVQPNTNQSFLRAQMNVEQMLPRYSTSQTTSFSLNPQFNLCTPTAATAPIPPAHNIDQAYMQAAGLRMPSLQQQSNQYAPAGEQYSMMLDQANRPMAVHPQQQADLLMQFNEPQPGSHQHYSSVEAIYRQQRERLASDAQRMFAARIDDRGQFANNGHMLHGANHPMMTTMQQMGGYHQMRPDQIPPAQNPLAAFAAVTNFERNAALHHLLTPDSHHRHSVGAERNSIDAVTLQALQNRFAMSQCRQQPVSRDVAPPVNNAPPPHLLCSALRPWATSAFKFNQPDRNSWNCQDTPRLMQQQQHCMQNADVGGHQYQQTYPPCRYDNPLDRWRSQLEGNRSNLHVNFLENIVAHVRAAALEAQQSRNGQQLASQYAAAQKGLNERQQEVLAQQFQTMHLAQSTAERPDVLSREGSVPVMMEKPSESVDDLPDEDSEIANIEEEVKSNEIKTVVFIRSNDQRKYWPTDGKTDHASNRGRVYRTERISSRREEPSHRKSGNDRRGYSRGQLEECPEYTDPILRVEPEHYSQDRSSSGRSQKPPRRETEGGRRAGQQRNPQRLTYRATQSLRVEDGQATRYGRGHDRGTFDGDEEYYSYENENVRSKRSSRGGRPSNRRPKIAVDTYDPPAMEDRVDSVPLEYGRRPQKSQIVENTRRSNRPQHPGRGRNQAENDTRTRQRNQNPERIEYSEVEEDRTYQRQSGSRSRRKPYRNNRNAGSNRRQEIGSDRQTKPVQVVRPLVSTDACDESGSQGWYPPANRFQHSKADLKVTSDALTDGQPLLKTRVRNEESRAMYRDSSRVVD